MRIDTGYVFWLSVVPPKATHQAKRIVRRGDHAVLADKPELVATRQTLDAAIAQALHGEPVTMLEGPLELELIFAFPLLKSHKAIACDWKPTRPDLDNLAKTVIDALARRGFFRDDAQIVTMKLGKVHNERFGIGVSLEALQPACWITGRATALSEAHGFDSLVSEKREVSEDA